MNNQMNNINYRRDNQWNGGPDYNQNNGFNRGNSFNNQQNHGNNYGNNYSSPTKPEINYTNMYTSPNNGGAYGQQQHMAANIDGITVNRPVGTSSGGECCCTMI